MPVFPDNWSTLDVTLCHDWLTGMRGGERVLEILCNGFPRAPILSLIHNRPAISDTINAHPVSVSWLQRMPGIFGSYRYWLPLFPSAINTLRAPPADLVLSTSHCVAKSVRPPDGARHLCYCFTPMRYAWTFFDEYFGDNALKAAVARPLLASLRTWDRRTSNRVDRFVAISHHVRERIQRFYGREADIVYPPVDTERCTPGDRASADFDLVVSALVPYKRIDLAVDAYTRLGYPLRVVGIGSGLDSLRARAGGNITFLGWQSDDDVLELYRNCRQLVFPGEEDFGIVPLEVQACGRPVVAFGRGGALETVQAGESGVFFGEQTVEALLGAVETASQTAWDRDAIRSNAERFGVQNFIDGLATSIERCLRDDQPTL
jgi:glycosyltransferase involved in cell wall biosynthesis